MWSFLEQETSNYQKCVFQELLTQFFDINWFLRYIQLVSATAIYLFNIALKIIQTYV